MVYMREVSLALGAPALISPTDDKTDGQTQPTQECEFATNAFPKDVYSREDDTHLYLVPRFRMRGAIPPLPNTF
jgi:hypothetical protein